MHTRPRVLPAVSFLWKFLGEKDGKTPNEGETECDSHTEVGIKDRAVAVCLVLPSILLGLVLFRYCRRSRRIDFSGAFTRDYRLVGNARSITRIVMATEIAPATRYHHASSNCQCTPLFCLLTSLLVLFRLPLFVLPAG